MPRQPKFTPRSLHPRTSRRQTSRVVSGASLPLPWGWTTRLWQQRRSARLRMLSVQGPRPARRRVFLTSPDSLSPKAMVSLSSWKSMCYGREHCCSSQEMGVLIASLMDLWMVLTHFNRFNFFFLIAFLRILRWPRSRSQTLSLPHLPSAHSFFACRRLRQGKDLVTLIHTR